MLNISFRALHLAHVRPSLLAGGTIQKCIPSPHPQYCNTYFTYGTISLVHLLVIGTRWLTAELCQKE